MIARTSEMQKFIKEANEAEFREYLVNKMHDNNQVILNGKNKKTLTIQSAIADIYELLEFLIDFRKAIALIKKYKKISITFGVSSGGGTVLTILKIWSII